MKQIIESAEPIFFPGNRTGCLLIHGFTGTPKEMLPLGEYLSGEGFTILAPRLFAHATRVEDMNRARWRDWIASVEDGWHLLRGMVDEVFIIGLSMGGVLSLYTSSYLPAAGTVVMSTPYQLPPDPRIPLLPLLWRLFPLADKGKDDWRNPHAADEHISYAKYPTRALMELLALLEHTRAALPTLTQPVLMFQSRDDETVLPDNMPLLHEHIGSSSKEMVWVENSGHVLTREPVQDFVFRTIYAFIQHNSTHHQSP